MTDSIDPELQAPDSTGTTAAERLAALRKPTENKRGKQAHAAKILAAGLSTTALFGMVTAMGWRTQTEAAQSSQSPTTTAPPSTPVVPSTTSQVTDDDDRAATGPTTSVPVVIPGATPVVQLPAPNAGRTPSNTVTKSSG